VNNNFSFFQRLKFAREGFRAPKRGLSWSFDWSRTNDEYAKVITEMKIGSSGFDRIHEYSRANNASINDVVLTGFIRSFVTTNTRNRIAVKPILVPSDLRKYIPAKVNTCICSLTGSIICNIGRETGSTFKETLVKVRSEMNARKQNHSDMNKITMISVLSGLMSYPGLKKRFMNQRLPPIPLVSNAGMIHPSDISFSGIPVEDAIITGAVSLGDFFSMTYSTFGNEMTFSVGYTGGDIQRKKVNDFLSRFKNELKSF
jgi:NRPS condensation-like uncharacterized protein